MNRRHFNGVLAAAAGWASSGCASVSSGTPSGALRLDPQRFTRMSVPTPQGALVVRAWIGVPVVERPESPPHQCLNLYVPEAYFQGGRVGRYDARSAPVFLPNAVGGYMPALPGTLAARQLPGSSAEGGRSASALALARGFVVAAPGARGRTLRTDDGRWTGKAPAAILDLKAAVRWLRHNADLVPGDMGRIVSNGTSAGGALSALLGAAGNHPEDEAALRAMGAAAARDDVFAVSAFCPITHLTQADGAYEWQFAGQREYRNVAVSMLDFQVQRREVRGSLDDVQMALAVHWRSAFASHVNGSGLRGPAGERFTVEADGGGNLRAHVEALLVASAQQAIDAGEGLGDAPWLRVVDGRARSADLGGWARAVGRMKAFPAFDGLSLETGENQLFGDAGTDTRHFTALSARHSRAPGAGLAPADTVRAMDAFSRLQDPVSTVARHWRIRHGTLDRDTALAVPALLAAAARQRGATVDLALAWGKAHAGDYELEALFDWAESVTGSQA